jgi:hypothetical protein
MKVVSLVERGGNKRSIVVKEVNVRSMTELLEQNVCKSANLMTDEHSAYVPAGKTFVSHGFTKHAKREYVRGTVHSNTVESSFSLLKRGLVGTFHHVGEQHLQRCVREFDFRWNNRKICDRERVEALLLGVAGKRLTYQTTARALGA